MVSYKYYARYFSKGGKCMKRWIGIYLFVLFSIFSVGAIQADAEEPGYKSMSVKEMFNKKEYSNGELILKFKDGVTDEQRKQFLSQNGLTEKSKLADGKILLVGANNAALKSIVAKLKNDRLIEFVGLNYAYNSTYIPKDPNYKDQWYLPKINAHYAWNQTRGSGQITVAVVDSGVDIQHADLKGKIFRPYNAVTGGISFSPTAHGTHVAGIIAATMNKTGIAGIAPQVKLMPVNVFTGDVAYTSDVINGIAYAVHNGADVINLSLGEYGYDPGLHYAVNYAYNRGVVVIAAAGNENTDEYIYPAAYEEVIGVSAVDKDDSITLFSNFGDYISLSAPGEDIYSTLPYNRFGFMDGTSMAAPVVSGVTALVLSKNPYLSVPQVWDILFRSAVDLGSRGWDEFYGYGRVDANRALEYTPIPMKDPVVSNKNFVMNGNNSITMAVNVAGSMTGSVYIIDEKGKRVRMLIDNKIPSRGKFSTYWDGKMDNGQYVPSGKYKIVFRITNGKRSMSKTVTVNVVDNVKPVIQLPQSNVTFSPIATPQKSLSFKLNKKATVSVSVYDTSGKLIKTLVKSKVYNSGTQTVQWDGKNAKGQYVKDGAYKVVFSAYTAKQKADPKQMIVNVDTKAPQAQIKLSNTTIAFDGTNKNIGFVIISESGTLNVFAQGSDGKKYTIVSGLKTSQRTNGIQWDGQSGSTYIPNGSYTVIVETQDAYGNKATFIGGKFTVQWNVAKLPVLTMRSVV
jgi:flagellar hook assembly protein FlgD